MDPNELCQLPDLGRNTERNRRCAFFHNYADRSWESGAKESHRCVDPSRSQEIRTQRMGYVGVYLLQVAPSTHPIFRSSFEHLAWYAGKAEIREYLKDVNKHSKVRGSIKPRTIEMSVLKDKARFLSTPCSNQACS